MNKRNTVTAATGSEKSQIRRRIQSGLGPVKTWFWFSPCLVLVRGILTYGLDSIESLLRPN